MSTWYINPNDPKKLTRGPNLSQGRSDLTCSLITKPSPQIVIAGGYSKYNDPSKRTDVLDLNTKTAVQGK